MRFAGSVLAKDGSSYRVQGKPPSLPPSLPPYPPYLFTSLPPYLPTYLPTWLAIRALRTGASVIAIQPAFIRAALPLEAGVVEAEEAPVVPAGRATFWEKGREGKRKGRRISVKAKQIVHRDSHASRDRSHGGRGSTCDARRRGSLFGEGEGGKEGGKEGQRIDSLLFQER